MNIWHDIRDERIKPNDFIVVIEIPKGSKKKYEVDKETGLIMLNRVLYTSTQYPTNYGFIPRTLSQDGDPLDVFVICSESLDPLCLVECYPIGVVEMLDDGLVDEKIIAIPFKDPYFNLYLDANKLPKHIVEETVHFLGVYKALEHGITHVSPLKGRAAAVKAIERAKANYKKAYGAGTSGEK